jgi:hypothetical protein
LTVRYQSEPWLLRSQSPSVLDSLLAQETGEAYLVLLTITDGSQDKPEPNPPFHFTSDSQDTVTDAGQPEEVTWSAFPFDITLPKNVEDQTSTAQLSVTNVDRRLIDSIRNQTVAMSVDIKVVLGSDPDDIMVEYVDFTWRNLTYDAMTVSGTLTLEDFLAEQVGHIMTANNYPGLFYQ